MGRWRSPSLTPSASLFAVRYRTAHLGDVARRVFRVSGFDPKPSNPHPETHLGEVARRLDQHHISHHQRQSVWRARVLRGGRLGGWDGGVDGGVDVCACVGGEGGGGRGVCGARTCAARWGEGVWWWGGGSHECWCGAPATLSTWEIEAPQGAPPSGGRNEHRSTRPPDRRDSHRA